MKKDNFIEIFSVSCETEARLDKYVDLLQKWQAKINLVSNSTLSDIWNRHIFDSAQLILYIKSEEKIIDLGSGAGLPLIVLGIMGIKNITAVESDNRKVAFLKEAARLCNIEIDIICKRAEAIDFSNFSLVTCRAFASIEKIFDIVKPVTQRFLLLKGENYQSEIDVAKNRWEFNYKIHKSITNNNAVVLEIENVKIGNKK